MSDERRMYLWATNGAREDGAGQEYRIKIPFRELYKSGLCYGYEATGQYPDKDLQAQLTADICQFYSVSGDAALHQIESIKKMKSGEINGIYQFPPVCVYDVDDNTDYVHPFNFTYVWLGIREYPSGRFISPGESLSFINSDGEEEILMEDGKTHAEGVTFNIAENLQNLKVRHRVIRACHGATVSTPALARYFKEVIGQPNVHVFPNTIVPEDYEYFDVRRKDKDEVRILWQGSPSHYVDWYPLYNPLKEIVQKYPNVKWVIYGWVFPWVHEIIPPERMEHYPWSHYQAYKLRRGLLNIDINLCPLADNDFNRCKSAIKWYESTIWNNPEATLAAKVEPYKEIQEGKTGLLYGSKEEFVQKLSLLIENAQLRKSLGREAKKWVLENRTPAQTIKPLHDFYQELKDRQRMELNPRIVVARR